MLRHTFNMLRHTLDMLRHTLDMLRHTFSVILSVILLLSYGVIWCHITAYRPVDRP